MYSVVVEEYDDVKCQDCLGQLTLVCHSCAVPTVWTCDKCEDGSGSVRIFDFSHRPNCQQKEAQPLKGLSKPCRALEAALAIVQALPADVKFDVGGEQVLAHQSVLAKRSPVFQTMFASGFKESAYYSVVELSGFTAPALRLFLNYMYSEELQLITTKEHALQLEVLELADKYNVEGLRTSLEEQLATALEPQDALASLMVASVVDVPALELAAVEKLTECLKTGEVRNTMKDMLRSRALMDREARGRARAPDTVTPDTLTAPETLKRSKPKRSKLR